MGWHPARDYWPGECCLALEADRGIVADANGKISQWRDLSARQNHAEQASAANQPTLVANALGTRPGVRFGLADTKLVTVRALRCHQLVIVADRQTDFVAATKTISGGTYLARGRTTGGADTNPPLQITGPVGTPADIRAQSSTSASFVNAVLPPSGKGTNVGAVIPITDAKTPWMVAWQWAASTGAIPEVALTIGGDTTSSWPGHLFGVYAFTWAYDTTAVFNWASRGRWWLWNYLKDKWGL